MPKKTTPNGASAASAEPQVSVAAGAAATSPAATREHGAEVPHHARLSLQPSPDLAFALSALRFFETLGDAQWEEVDKWEIEYREGRFKGDIEGWTQWVKGTAHGFEADQHEAINDMSRALEVFIRQRKCRTLGDLVTKVQLNAYWMKCSVKDVAADYAEEAAILLRSILPLAEALEPSEEAAE